MLKNMRGMLWVALIIFGAIIQPQDSDARLIGQHVAVQCGDCHTGGFAGSVFTQSPNCLGACHTQQLAESDASQLFNYVAGAGDGNSHAWGVPFYVPGAGAASPVTTKQSRYSYGKLGCSSCHWPHYAMDNLTGLSTNSLLKRDNSADQLCLDCHRSRDITDASTPQTGKQMSHPVGVTIPGDSAHNSPPLETCCVGVAGSKLLLLGGDTVSCSTCHGVHFADSDPNTPATMGGLTPAPDGKGMLLRRYNDSQLCKDCHYYQQHGPSATPAKWQDCRNCHSPHSVGTNKKLIRFDNMSTPFGNRTAIFDSLTSQFVYRPDGKYGICDVCHEIATTFVTWSSGHASKGINKSEAWKSNCITCHSHAEGDGTSVGSFAAGGAAACGTCHGYPPIGDGEYPNPPTGWAAGYDGELSFMNESTVGKHKIHAVTYPYASSGSYGTGACKACHGFADDSTHENGNFQNIGFKLYTGFGWTPNYDTGNYECTNVYCHSNGAPSDVIGAPAVTADWDTGAALTCAGCHASTPTTNRHTPHAAGNYNFGCENCHATTVSDNTTISDTNVHVNRVKDVAFGGFTAAAGSYDTGTNVCSNNYCHGEFSNGNNTNDPDWDVTGAACGTCHDVDSPKHTAVSHDRHVTVAAGKYGFDCAYCHDEQMDESDNSSLTSYVGHVNGVKSIKFLNDLQGRTNFDGIYTGGKCNKTYCHSAGTSTASANFFVNSSSVSWSLAVTTCDSCHGDSTLGGWTSAMPNYTSVSIKENSHKAHVVNNGYDCNICHDTIVGADNASITDTANHVDGNYDVNFAAPYDAGGAIYIAGTPGSCDNVSCHGGNLVNWGATVGCEDCHGTTGADVDQNGDFGNATAAQIAMSQWTTTGHGRDSGSTYFSGASGAGKGCLEAGSGAGCHDAAVSHGDAGNPFRLYTSPTDTNFFCKECHAASGAEFHAYTTTDGRWTFDVKCLDCHDAHGDDNIFMIHSTIYQSNPGNNWAPSDTFGIQDDALPPVNVDFTNNASAADFGDKTAVDGKAQVCNVCHTRTTQQNPPTAFKRYQRDMATGDVDVDHFSTTKCTACHQHKNGFEGESCEACHGMPPTSTLNLISSIDNEQSGSDTAGMHTKHVAVYTAGTNCELCHDGGMSVSPNDFNGRLDMDFSSSLGTYTTGTYDGQSLVETGLYQYTGVGEGTANDSYKCNSVKCHGTALVALGGKGYNTTPEWNVTATGDCGTCHAAKQAPGTPFTNASAYPDSASHAKHAGYAAGEYDIMCKACHNASLSDAVTPIDSVHVNAEANVALEDGGTYAGTTAIGGGYGACNSSYCHSDGTDFGSPAAPKNAIIWGTASNCGTCHAGTATGPDYGNGTPKPNSHSTHVVTNNFDCVACHYNTTRDNLSIYSTALHVNKAYDVDMDPAYDDGDFTYGAQCLLSDCHGNNATTWGAASLACENCHNNAADVDDFTYSNFSGTMSALNSTDWTTTGHGKSGTNYASGNAPANKGCTDCHDDTKPHADGAEYFRLYTSDSDALCLGCHGLTSKGERGKSWTDFANVTGIQGHTWENISTAGYQSGGASGKAGWDYTPKCVDCHDPHGDDNGYMVHSFVNVSGSDAIGRPAGVTRSVDFATLGNWSSYVKNTSYDGICQRCHDSEVDFFDKSQFDSSHNPGTICINCHAHNVGFTPSGCDTCHGQSGVQIFPPDGPNSPVDWAEEAATPASVGSHEAHVTKLSYACSDCHGGGDGRGPNHGTGKNYANMNNMTTVHGDWTDGGTTGVASVTDDTCSNVDCHSGEAYERPWINTPEITDCGVCHGERAQSGLTNISTGSHYRHTYNGAGYKNYLCTQCHVDNTGNFSHYSTDDVDMNFTAPAAATTYVRGTGFATFTTGNEWDACNNSYCHGATLPAGAPGDDSTPVWGDPTTAECGDCHMVTTAESASDISSGSHTMHVTTLNLSCGNCHTADTAATHVDGAIDFILGGTKALTTACDSCHGAGAATAKDEWSAGTTQTCESCHEDAADVKDYTYSNMTGAGMVAAKIKTSEWTSTGHGLDSASKYSPDNVNSGAQKACTACHDDAVNHGVATNPFRLTTNDTNALCLGCHDGAGAGESALDPANHHISVTNLGGRASWPFDPKCVDCHDPHGDGNISMIRSSVNTPTTASNYVTGGGSNAFGIPTSGGTLTAVTFLNRDGFAVDSYADSGTLGTGICEICHSNAVTVPVGWYNRQGDGNLDNHAENGGAACNGCHNHNEGFQGGGESGGGDPCGGCHASLFNNMTAQSSYHHYITDSAAIYYSDNVDTIVDRTCLTCHVDHDIFRPDLNAGFGTRAANLRQDAITLAGDIGQGDATDLINTDFWPANPKYTGETAPVSGDGAKNGVCISCHDSITNPFLTKNTSNRGAGDGSLKARGINTYTYYSSSHNFQVVSSQNNFADGSSFRANCSKCHGSSAINKPSAQTGQQFGLHDSSIGAVLRPNGQMGSPPATLKDDLCYSCHSKDERASGGPGDTYDFYSSVVMAPGSKLIKAASTAKTYGHPTQATTAHKPDEYYDAQATGVGTWNSGATRHVECVDCHNTHGGNSNIVRVVGGPGCCSDDIGTPVTDYGNAVAGAQKGVWGVELDYSGKVAGELPAFTKVEEVDTQYGVCIKCHSAYAYNASPPSIPSGGIDQAGVTAGVPYDTIVAGIAETDQSKEFNPENAGYHPVLAVGRNQPPSRVAGNAWPNGGGALASPGYKYYNVYTQMTGFYNYSGLGYTFVPPWSNTSLMSCTDCHAADNTGTAVSSFVAYSTVTQGDWDTDVAGGTLGTNDAIFATSIGTTPMRVDLSGPSFPLSATKIELAIYVSHEFGKNDDFPYEIFVSGGSVGSGVLTTTASTGGSFIRMAADVSLAMASCDTAACLEDNTEITFGVPLVDAYLTKIALEAYYPFTEKLRGPHGSLGRWILETANRDITFQRASDGTWITPNASIVAGSDEEKVFCYNCHRRDVYYGYDGSNTYPEYSRGDHAWGSANSHIDLKNPWGIWCMNCHGGRGSGGTDKNGGIHGIYEGNVIYAADWNYATATGSITMPRPLGVRLLYGGTAMMTSDATGQVYCYTNTNANATGACTSEEIGDWANDYVTEAGRITTVQYTYTAW